MKETWKDVVGYEGLYLVSDQGRIYSKTTKKILSTSDSKGYRMVALYKNGMVKKHFVHRVVAFAFLPMIKDKEQVNHKNFIKDDNRLVNLEWCNPWENFYHSYYSGRLNGRSNKVRREKVIRKKPYIKYIFACYDINGKFVKDVVFYNIDSEKKYYKIRKAIKNNKSFNGYFWSYEKKDSLELCSHTYVKKGHNGSTKGTKYSSNNHKKGSDNPLSKKLYVYDLDWNLISVEVGIANYFKERKLSPKHAFKVINKPTLSYYGRRYRTSPL